MPTYEYRCEACEHRFELFQPITSNPVRKCPKCGRLKVRRLISGGGAIIFKGSGFYATDYRSDSYRQAAKKDSAPTPAPAAPAAGAATGAATSSAPSTSTDSASAASKPAEKPKQSSETRKGHGSSKSSKAAR
jgi:putative FmdB family regulatory protein